VGHLYRFVAGSSTLKGDNKQVLLDVPTAVNKAAIMRESALKSVIFTGVPRVSHEMSILSHENASNESFPSAHRRVFKGFLVGGLKKKIQGYQLILPI